uniref:Uncharacterized protein n=1 Tax=Tanacetum cinerariifolium TaxID=118510 RepID=A0A6L2NWA1_TANCI|nr:hypothetical protein [Tanacetum cinerariifolium]
MSKESTLQVVYDVLRLTPFYKAFLVTTDVPEIYMQEFWATAIVHHHSICFKMNNKKRIINLEYFREMLHICPRIPNQTFDELSFEEEVLAFMRYLGHNGEIKKITDEDFVYQVEHKDAKKSNEMYYPKFTKVTINFFMTKDPSTPRRNKVNWHYIRDDQMFTMIKLVSRHHNTQQFGAMLPVELTNEDIRNSAAYKEYYAIASGAAPPKTKESVRKTHSSSDTTMPPPTAAGIRLLTSAKGKQHAKSSKAKGVPNVQTYESDEEISWKSSDEDDDDDVDDQSDVAAADDDQDDNDDDQDLDNDSDDFVHPKLSTHDKEAKDEESFDPIVQTPSQVEKSDDESHGMNVRGDEGPDAEDDDEELYGDVNINLEGRDVQMTDVHITQVLKDTHVALTLVNPDGQRQIEPLLLTASTLPPLSIPTISQIIKEQVKEQVKVHVSKILPKIEKTVNEQLEAEVLTQASNSSKTSYVVAADLSELELKRILIEKMESNKSIHRSDEQRNLYKALVDAYECDKIILDTYGDTVTLKICRDNEDKDEEPSAGSDRGSKRRRAGKEPESTSALKKKASKPSGKSTEGSKSHQKTASKSAPVEEPMKTTQYLEEPSHQEFETGAADDQPVAEASQHPE